MTKSITIEEKKCNFCNHRWLPRAAGRPHVCPKCKNPRWDEKPKFRRKKAETVEMAVEASAA